MNSPRILVAEISSLTHPACKILFTDSFPILYPNAHRFFPIKNVISINANGIIAPSTFPVIPNVTAIPYMIVFNVPQSIVSPIPDNGPINPVLIPVIAPSVISPSLARSSSIDNVIP